MLTYKETRKHLEDFRDTSSYDALDKVAYYMNNENENHGLREAVERVLKEQGEGE